MNERLKSELQQLPWARAELSSRRCHMASVIFELRHKDNIFREKTSGKMRKNKDSAGLLTKSNFSI